MGVPLDLKALALEQIYNEIENKTVKIVTFM